MHFKAQSVKYSSLITPSGSCRTLQHSSQVSPFFLIFYSLSEKEKDRIFAILSQWRTLPPKYSEIQFWIHFLDEHSSCK